MADVFSREKRSAIMARIRSRGNRTTEERFVRILRKHRVAGWRRGSKLPGQPDIVFPKSRVAVFVDGDFWHGNPRRFRLPKTNRAYWREKIASNRRRDRSVSRRLRAMGWTVLRLWESDLVHEEKVVRRVKRAFEQSND